MRSTIYTVNGMQFELQHYGVKGMKWGRRKARPEPIGRTRKGKPVSPADEAAMKDARAKKAKRAVKIGAAIIGTALAAYGAMKLHDVIREKNYQFRMKQGSKAIDKYIKQTTSWSTLNEDWRVRRANEDRDRKYFEQVYRSASRQADNDSFRTAAENVLYDWLDERRRR